MNKELRAEILKEVIREINKTCCGTIMDRQAVINKLIKLYEDASDNGHKRRIVCAANRFPDGTVILGARHWDPWMHATRKKLNMSERVDGLAEQGFIDNERNFLTREEAWIVANEAGQIIRRVGGDEGCLYSENIC